MKETQIQQLKRTGLYGSTKDPFWNKTTKRHECCGSTRSYYHLSGCSACVVLDHAMCSHDEAMKDCGDSDDIHDKMDYHTNHCVENEHCELDPDEEPA